MTILKRLALLSRFPEMYQVESGGEFAGLRRIPLGYRSLYYVYWHPDNTIYLEFLGFPPAAP